MMGNLIAIHKSCRRYSLQIDSSVPHSQQSSHTYTSYSVPEVNIIKYSVDAVYDSDCTFSIEMFDSLETSDGAYTIGTLEVFDFSSLESLLLDAFKLNALLYTSLRVNYTSERTVSCGILIRSLSEWPALSNLMQHLDLL